jgi:hypothetical protein
VAQGVGPEFNLRLKKRKNLKESYMQNRKINTSMKTWKK